MRLLDTSHIYQWESQISQSYSQTQEFSLFATCSVHGISWSLIPSTQITQQFIFLHLRLEFEASNDITTGAATHNLQSATASQNMIFKIHYGFLTGVRSPLYASFLQALFQKINNK